MKFIQFLRSTKIISRILLIVWVFFSLAGAGFDPSQFIYTFPVLAIFFVLPAVIIEYKKNPIISELKDSAKIKKIEADIVAQEQKKQNALRIQELQKEQTRLSEETAIEIERSQSIQQPVDAQIAKKQDTNPFAEKESDSIPKESPNVNKQNKKPRKKEEKKQKPYLSHRIGGITLIVLSSLLCTLFIGVFIEKDFTLLFPASFGLLCLFLGIALFRGAFMNSELSKKRKGVYLSQEQFEKLENRIELPIVDTPLFLKNGEVAVYYCQASLIITKNRVIGRTGSYGGGTVRIAKGLSVHTGSSSSRSIYGDVSTSYSGEFIITNQRIVFVNSQKGFELAHDNITAATYDKYGFVFQAKNKSYVLSMKRTDIAVIAFDGVRIGDIPIAGSYISTTHKSNMNNKSSQTSQMSATEHAELAQSNIQKMGTTLDPDEFFLSYKNSIYHFEQVTSFWRSQGGDAEIEELMESLIEEKEDYINEFFDRCYNEGVLQQLKEKILRHSTELTKGNIQYMEELLNGELDEMDSDDEETVVKEVCSKLKKNLRIDMAFWNEMHLDFRCNLVTSYDQLQLNYEIKNTSGVPWYCGGGGIEIKANVYNADGDLLCVEDDYIDDDEIAKNRYSAYILFHLDDVKEAAYIEIFAHQDM